MEIHVKKNEALELVFPMVETANPEQFDTGETVADTAYYNDGGAWTTLAITDTITEIGTTGVYQLSMAQAEMNHDVIMIKLSSTNAVDSLLVIRTYAVDIDDLVRATTPANTLDVSAGGEAGIDWANVGSPTTSVDLSATSIDLCDEVTLTDTVTDVTNQVTAAEINAEVDDALDTAFTDATGLTANGLLDRIRTLCWLIRNKMTVVNASGNTVVFKDNNSTEAFSTAGCLTDDDTDTVRLRIE